MPGVISESERQLVRFLYAVRHVERRHVYNVLDKIERKRRERERVQNRMPL